MTSSQNNRICDTLSYFALKKGKRISSILTTVHPYLILFIRFHFHRVFKIGISLLLKCKITCTNFELFVHGALLSTALFRYKHIETTGIVCIVFKYLTRPKGLLAYFSIKTTNLFDPVFLTRQVCLEGTGKSLIRIIYIQLQKNDQRFLFRSEICPPCIRSLHSAFPTIM